MVKLKIPRIAWYGVLRQSILKKDQIKQNQQVSRYRKMFYCGSTSLNDLYFLCMCVLMCGCKQTFMYGQRAASKPRRRLHHLLIRWEASRGGEFERPGSRCSGLFLYQQSLPLFKYIGMNASVVLEELSAHLPVRASIAVYVHLCHVVHVSHRARSFTALSSGCRVTAFLSSL